MYWIWILSNKLRLNPETFFYYTYYESIMFYSTGLWKDKQSKCFNAKIKRFYWSFSCFNLSVEFKNTICVEWNWSFCSKLTWAAIWISIFFCGTLYNQWKRESVLVHCIFKLQIAAKLFKIVNWPSNPIQHFTL